MKVRCPKDTGQGVSVLTLTPTRLTGLTLTRGPLIVTVLGLVGGAPGTLTRGRLLLPSVLQPLACLFQNMAAARSCVPIHEMSRAHEMSRTLRPVWIRVWSGLGWWRVYVCFYAI